MQPILTVSNQLVRTGFASKSGAAEASANAAAALAPPLRSWQEAMRLAIRDVDQLRQRLHLPPDPTPQVAHAQQGFATFVPLEFLSRIRPGDPHDPLLRQVLPVSAEAQTQPGFIADPVGDSAARVSTGLLQKYAGRALLIATGVCGVHCRYCFRRQFDYSPSSEADAGRQFQAAIDYLRRHESLDEVILSGGVPLTLSDGRLDKLVTDIEAIPHVRRLRIHSRMPIVIPQRVTEELVTRWRTSRLAVWMVIHCNHAQEIDAAVGEALDRMLDQGIPVLNQAVLLAGVNDDVETLAELCRELINRRVQPYYLHQLDRVAGAAHFEVPLERGRELIAALRARLPGYAVPTFVSEIAGETSKRPNG